MIFGFLKSFLAVANRRVNLSTILVSFIMQIALFGGIYYIYSSKLSTLFSTGETGYLDFTKAFYENKTCNYVEGFVKSYDLPDLGGDIQDNIGYQNNKFGIYIYPEVEEYFDQAAELVNSNGGDWGYVLIPYNVKDYDEGKWGKIFEKLNDKKLIPIIQLWDLDVDNKEKRDKQIEASAIFLSQLKWPIQNKYVSLYNEVNDEKFWRGKIDPEGYAEVVDKSVRKLKALDKDFFVLNGAFNTSARTSSEFLDTRDYMIRMNKHIPGIFNKLDGWASHPYPQPNFSGPANGKGRDSIRAYEWELGVLRDLGVNTLNLPVFITETGWAHRDGDSGGVNSKFPLSSQDVAKRFVYAYESVWLPDERIVAVTPFTIWYQEPFDNFSWVRSNKTVYPQFTEIKSMFKTTGKPPLVRYQKTKIVDCVDKPIKSDDKDKSKNEDD